LKDVNWLSDLKLRASYGITGNQNGINDYAAQGLWSGSYSYPDNSGGAQPGTAPLQLANPNLKWERTAQTDIGVDVGLLAEEFDPVAGRMLGNFPQAYSHVGLINSALSLDQYESSRKEQAAPRAIRGRAQAKRNPPRKRRRRSKQS